METHDIAIPILQLCFLTAAKSFKYVLKSKLSSMFFELILFFVILFY